MTREPARLARAKRPARFAPASPVSSAAPANRAARELAADLRALGVRPGQDLLVHCSMRRVGPVPGGAATLLRALRSATGPQSTLVVPAQTRMTSLSSTAFRAATGALDAEGMAWFIATMAAFDPATTPSSGMGVFAEHVRATPGSARSAHPLASFAALGPRAAECMATHDMDCHLGERSPLGWLYQADAAVLLLGVGYSACTAFHLAAYRLPRLPALREYRCLVAAEGARREFSFTDIELHADDFEKLGERVDREPFVRRGRVGSAANCRLLPIRGAVDFAAAWPPFRRRRDAP
jgi:aminoglycoside 3-N-acetyltransferase